jgi:hypothetical protein
MVAVSTWPALSSMLKSIQTIFNPKDLLCEHKAANVTNHRETLAL